MPAADVIELAVIGFADDGVDAADVFIAFLVERIGDDPFDALGHGKRVGQHDRRLDGTQFTDLRHAGEFAEAVAHINGGGAFAAEEIAFMRHDRRDAGTHIVTFNDCDLTDFHAGDVGNGVIGSGLENTRSNAEITDAAALGRLGECRQTKGKQQERYDDSLHSRYIFYKYSRNFAF